MGNSYTELKAPSVLPKIGNSATTLPFQLGQPKGGNEDRERVPFPSGGSGRIGMAPRFQVDLGESIPPLAAIVEEGVPGSFRDAAPDLLARGLAVVPCGSVDGKVPLVEWGKWTKRPGRAFIEKMRRRYPSANVGIVVGLSGITVVDCDDPAAVAVMVARCGDTPLKVRTPSGGVHLYYRAAGERCADLRPEGLKVDVKGIGGFVVAPPSVRPDGPHAGRAYEFLEGSWRDLSQLPAARPGSLPTTEDGARRPARLRAVRQGWRNNTLFRLLLRQARYCDSLDALLDIAEGVNQDFAPPLSAAEVADAARSAWGYEERGENWAGREPRVSLTRAQHDALRAHRHGSDAWFLLATLRFSHWDRDGFAAAPKAMAAD